MRKNLAGWDRGLRFALGAALGLAAVVAPVSMTWSLLLAANAVYLALSAFAGTCLGYRLMGKSTCPVRPTT